MIMPTYVLEMPKEPGEAQKELGIENVQLFNEASYVISAINPNTTAIINAIQEKATIENLYLRK
jgi:hypothetical protein